MNAVASRVILVSSCLLGLDTRYNGVCKKDQDVLDFLSAGNWTIIPVCPEQLAGLSTPRPATQFSEGDGSSLLKDQGTVVNAHREPMNSCFVKGAEQTLEIARLNDCTQAILKERSPSCGVHQIYRNDTVVPGDGVTTALLKKCGISVFSENDLNEIPEPFNAKKG